MEKKKIFVLVYKAQDEQGQDYNDLICFWFQAPTADQLAHKIYGKSIMDCTKSQINTIVDIASGNDFNYSLLQLEEGEVVEN